MVKIKNENYFHAQVKEVHDLEKGKIKIRGFASTPDPDRYGDIVDPAAFEDALKKYMQNPQILLMHDPEKPIGSATSAQITERGLVIEAELTPDGSEEIDVALTRVRQGKYRTLSIGYIPLELVFVHKDTSEIISQDDYMELPYNKMKEYQRRITKLDLLENSIVTIPAQGNAVFTMQKSLTKYFEDLESQYKQANESVIYNINANDMSKKNIKEDEKAELEKKELEDSGEENENVNEDESVNTEEAEVETQEETETSEDSEEKDVENPDETQDSEEEAEVETDEGEESWEDVEAEEAEEEVVEAEQEQANDEKSIKLDSDSAKSFIKGLGNIVLANPEKKELEVDLKKLVDINDSKALAHLCEKLVELNISQSKQINEMTAILNKIPQRKAVATFQYPHTQDAVKKNIENAKKELSQKAFSDAFAKAGVQLKD